MYLYLLYMTHIHDIQHQQKNRSVVSLFKTYFRDYINLRFKHAVLGTHLSCLGCLTVS